MEKHGVLTDAISYIRDLYAPEDELLLSIRKTLEANNIAIQIGAEEGRLLQVFITMAGVTSIVELGTLGGYSTVWMARALPDDGKIYTVESNAKHAGWARDAFVTGGLESKVDVLEGRAQDVLAELDGTQLFDMLFIDADKAGYPNYWEWAQHNIRKGGLVIADNTLKFSDIAMYENCVGNKSWQAMQDFNVSVANASGFMSVIVPTYSGLTISVKL